MPRAIASLLAVVAIFVGSTSMAAPTAAIDEDFSVYSRSASLAEDHANVFRLYWAFFDRSPDVDGARYWAGQYDLCASLLDVTWSFSNSAEFAARYGRLSHQEYVELVYSRVLDRLPDAEGEAYWLGLLDSGELIPSEVMLYFSLSDEFRSRHPLPSDGRAYAGCTAPAAPTTTSQAPVYYRNCTEARAAGAAPIYEDQPGYRSGLDRDDDGVACE
jgi:hypothetical protein